MSVQTGTRADTAPAALGRRARNRTVAPWALVSAAMFAVAWGGNEFTPLLVMYRLDHGYSPVVVDSFLFAYVFGIVPALLIGGPLSDRLGRRPVMLPAPFIAAAGSLVLATGADSSVLLVGGRILSGIGLGIGMAVGGSWLKELSAEPWDRRAGAGSGARRAAMSLTAGFALGAGVAGVLAQWAPWPSALAYLVHISIAVVAGVALFATPETRPVVPADQRVPLREDLRIPAAGHLRFRYVIVPLAPWVFGSASCAYAVMPALMAEHSGGRPVAFSALLCVVALAGGFSIQAVGRRIDTPRSARAVAVALAILVVGMTVAAVAADRLTVPLALAAAVVLGGGYGMALVSGLQEIQRIARPDDLAGLTAVFYSLTYIGFAVPAAMALCVQAWPTVFSYPLLFLIGAVVAAASLVLVLVKSRSHLPTR
ncbi:Predicted arabinose efflux permease, MFS family [Rhodococcus maanshanensis]|uniref:Predicted arabinose efflux permease, MFS family n=2 Tax=Rhodococcus maanshanensis TaxID=183556 RepID=A0A1H7HGU6_9NOCA|nr:Predicted arabinose efflux permease, MFS family [Rhodococcus maanshanensis]